MNRSQPTILTLGLTAALSLACLPLSAQSTQAASPREIIDRLIAEREESPSVAPEAQPPVEVIPNRVGVPASAVDLDASVVGVLPGAPLPKLRREGEFIIERPGQLLAVDNGLYWVFAFDAVAGEPDLRPMIVQKCQRLASMQDTLDQRTGSDLGFTITGQVHTYRGVNYLLPTAISGTRQLPPGTNAENAPPPPPVDQIDYFSSELDAGGTPATFDGGGGNAGGADPIDLIESLLDERDEAPSRPDTIPIDSPINRELDEALQGIREQQEAEEKLRREGDNVRNRTGRLIRGIGGAVGGEASNVLFAFESDGQDPAAAEAPMLVMPCKLLELMENTVVERGDQAVFIVTGRVYAYRGANYLLPTTMRFEYDLGNISN